METAIGVFTSRERAEEAFKELLDHNVPQESIAFLTQSETEATSMAKDLGAFAGGFLGGAAGMAASVVGATVFLIPGFGQAFAIGVAATALLGLAGAGAGSAMGKAVAGDAPRELPDNEDAALFRKLLKEGHSILIVRTEFKDVAQAACQVLDRMSIGTTGPAQTKTEAVTRQVGDVCVIDLKGNIILGEGNVLIREMLTDLMAQGKKLVILNLREVDHIDSAGIGELVRSHSTLRRRGGQLKLANLSPKVNDVIRMISLHAVFDIYGDEQAAVKSFAASA
jgi:anti-sigma B factor antagonist